MICQEEKRQHIPVMAEEVLEYLVPQEGEYRFVDCTLGYGGHSEMILKKNSKIKLLGIDQDQYAIKEAEKKMGFAETRFFLEKGRFSEVEVLMKKNAWNSADYFLLDIGVSSPQIDEPERGFSYRFKGPLDMRMDTKRKKTAAQILNYSSVEELAGIFRDYGEIKQARRLAKAIIERRKEKPWFDTSEFAAFCDEIIPAPRKGGMPTPTLCFQALRIAVNEELEELEKTLKIILGLLNKKGRVGVISYHSLEDRIVKNIFRNESMDCLCPPGLPECVCGHKAAIKLITKKPLVPKKDELAINNRARSAKMRIAEKL